MFTHVKGMTMSMKKSFRRIALPFLITVAATILLSAEPYDRYFTDSTMRIDVYHSGTKGAESFTLDKVYHEGPWPGSRRNLTDTLNLGEYLVRVFDFSTNTMIFSRGYSTMFNEWQTTDEAVTSSRTFHETIRLPYPKSKVEVSISRRDKHMIFQELYTVSVDPSASAEVHRDLSPFPYDVITLMENGPSSEKVDVVIVGDGYRKADLEKFRKDAKHYNEVMFSTSPFKEHKGDFNVRAIEVISKDSGIDKPDKNIWKTTALGTRYYTFGSARYVLTDENKALRDIIDHVPYDFVLILLNDNRYGGGGIYNLYSTCFTRTDVPGLEWQMDYVYVHEFGHCFGGLGDEYYSSQVAYNDFYPKGVEPWEPNLTALTDPDHLKWKQFIDPDVPVPTPWDKSRYDSLERERGKLDRLAPDYYKKREPLYQAEQKILKESKYAGKVGAFEGAGYASEGIYRPAIDCRMFSLSLIGFDPVCSAAITRVINFYSH